MDFSNKYCDICMVEVQLSVHAIFFLLEGIVSGGEYIFVKVLKIKSVLFVEAALRTDGFPIFWLPL